MPLTRLGTMTQKAEGTNQFQCGKNTARPGCDVPRTSTACFIHKQPLTKSKFKTLHLSNILAVCGQLILVSDLEGY